MLRQPRHGAAPVSEGLRRFVAESPLTRQSILDFVLRAAGELPPGSRVLDVGAGDSPYREVFAGRRYESNEWQHSTHAPASAADHVGPAHALPVSDAQYDAVLLTEVLEHVPNPDAVMRELYRILAPGGRLYMTTPFTIEVHGMPWDYHRYAPAALFGILERAGFANIDVRPRTDCFTALAQLLQDVPAMINTYPDGRDHERVVAKSMALTLSQQLLACSGLDQRAIFPLGFSAAATKPKTDAPPRHRGTRDRATRAALGLEHARSMITICFLADVLADRHMLPAYARAVGAGDDATLVIYAPHVDVAAASAALRWMIKDLGLDGQDSPDMIALPFRDAIDERPLAQVTDAVLSLRPPWGDFSGIP